MSQPVLSCLSRALPHPEVPRSGLEGGAQGSLWCLEGSFEARSRRHLRMRWSDWTIYPGQ
ncbi:hypothetical protein FPV16_07040 [Methylobacterium sp. W2]|nr:hypothetical protein [Methylobacterium sp. W2]